MINWKSIISSFNDKPTLLEWLKLAEKALKESVLTSVTTEQDADKANTKLIFNFEDGTQIDTGFFPTKGKDAAEIRSATSLYIGTTGGLSKSRVTFDKTDGRSFYADIMAKAGKAVESFSSAVKEVTDENTVNTITANYDDKTSNTFEVSSARGKQGAKGDTGVSITGIETVSDEVVGDETHTTLRANYSNNTSDEFVVTAKNGKTPTIDPFINGQIIARTNQSIDTRNVKNKIYYMQCYDNTGNLQKFTVNGVTKSVDGEFAMVIFGKDSLDSLAIVQTGSVVITELAKTTSRVTGFTPSKGNFLAWYEINGTGETGATDADGV